MLARGLAIWLFANATYSISPPTRRLRPPAKAVVRRDAYIQTREAISSQERTLKRMQYWSAAGAPKPPTLRFLIFSHDVGGPNNLRIGWEMVGIFAQRANRTLVLPPAKAVYLLDNGPLSGRSEFKSPNFEKTSVTKMEDLINLGQLKANLPTLTWDEFQNQTGLTFEKAQSKAARVGAAAGKTGNCPTLKDVKAVHADILFLDGEHFRQGFACGEWWQLGGPDRLLREDMRSEDWKLLTHGFVWHPDAYSIASKVVDYLGLFQYNALHGRYGDLQYQECKTEPSRIFQNWPSLLQGVKTLYIASDNPEKFNNLSNFGTAGVVPLRWSDLFTEKTNFLLKAEQAKYTPERWFKLMGPVEELICTFSKLFVGTRHSTFTGHIHRMRIHAQAPVTDAYDPKKKNRVLSLLNYVHDKKEVVGDIQQQLVRWRAKEASYHGHDPIKGDIFLQLDQRET